MHIHKYCMANLTWNGRLLEVGALKHDNYRSCTSWIDVTSMDLRSRHPAIIEQNFLLMDSEVEHHEKWDIISLSLVVNFVPEPRDRGSPIAFLNIEKLMFADCRTYAMH